MKALFVIFFMFQVISNAKTRDLKQDGNAILSRIKKHVTLNAQRSRAKDPMASICSADEIQYSSIESGLLATFKNMIIQKDINRYLELFEETFSTQGLPFATSKIVRAFSNEGILEFQIDKDTKIQSRVNFQKKMNEFFKNIRSMEFVQMDTVEVISNKNMRASDHLAMMRAELKIRFDMRFVNSKHQKVNNRGILILDVKKNPSKEWKIASMAISSGASIVSESESLFSPVVSSTFENSIPKSLRREAIRRGGYATALGDFDNDGKVDLFLGAAQTSKIYKGDGQGSFAELINSGIEPHTLVKSAAFVDLFNSGRQDLILVRFAPEEGEQKSADSSDIVIYKNEGERFKRLRGAIIFKNNHPFAMPLAIGDFNKDSLLDLYVGFPGARDFTFLKEKNPLNNQSKQAHGFFLNKGQASSQFYETDIASLWKKEYKKSGNDSKWLIDSQFYYPHSAVAFDYNLDQNMDVAVIDDRTQISLLFQGNSKGELEKSNEKVNFKVADYGMGLAFGDLLGSGSMDFIMTSVNFASSERMMKSCAHNWDQKYSNSGHKGLRYFQNKEGKYTEVSESHGLDFAGYGLSGVELIDYNNDGNLDVFVSNGLWSSEKSETETDLSSLFTQASNMTLFEMDLLPDGKLYPRFQEKPGRVNVTNSEDDYTWAMQHYPTQSAIMNVLVNGRTSKGQHYSLGGFQKKRVFRNNGDGSFTEVAYALGLDSIADGYMVAQADLNGDGNLDVVLRNSDPGVSVSQFSPLEIYLNKTPKIGNSIILSFQGDSSVNRDGIGTIVRASVSGKKMTRQLSAMNGTIQSQKIIHIGLGSADVAEEVEVLWPDGTKDMFKNMKKGFHKITKGSKLARTDK